MGICYRYLYSIWRRRLWSCQVNSMRPNYMINRARLCLNKNGSSFLILLNKYWCSSMPQIGYTQRYGRLEGVGAGAGGTPLFSARLRARWNLSHINGKREHDTRITNIPLRISFYVRLTIEPALTLIQLNFQKHLRKLLRKAQGENTEELRIQKLGYSTLHKFTAQNPTLGVRSWAGVGSGVSRSGCAGSPHERALHTAERHALRAPALAVSPRARPTIFGAKNPGFRSDTVIATDSPSHSHERFMLLLLVACDNGSTLRTLLKPWST